LSFIEVKTRSSEKFGFPEEAVSKNKLRHLQKAAEIFLTKNPQYQNCQLRIDVAAIELCKDREMMRYYKNVTA
jgi:putative endonuclease